MSYRRTLTWSLAAAAMAACTPKADSAEDTDIVVEDTDDTDPVVVDTDDTDPVVVDTDDTDPVADTDDTDVTDTDVAAAVDTTIRTIRQRTGGFGFGDLLHIQSVTVVEVRSSVTGPRGFTVQEAGADYAALWVDVPSPGLLPNEGASVGVIGVYRELGAGPTGSGTQSQLQISPTLADTEWIQLGVSTRPVPVTLTPDAYHANPEPYESMRVLLDNGADLEVTDGPRVDDSFDLTPIAALYDLRVLPLFYSAYGSAPNAIPHLGVGDTFGAVAGTVWYDAGGYALAPTALTDLPVYIPYVPPVDTDIGPDTDTQVPVDTDTGIISPPDTDTGVPGPLIADVEKLHSGIYTVGTIGTPNYLIFQTGTVTAVRYRTTPPATNAVAVQFPSFATKGGIYVWMSSAQTLPQIGDVINFTGNYVEDPNGGSWPNNTLSMIRIEPSNTNASWSKTGTASVPTPVELTIADLLSASTAEPYESMLVRLSDPAGYVVSTNPGSSGEFRIRLSTGGSEIIVDDHFFNLVTAYGVNTGDTMTSLTGVVHFEGTSYKLGPTTQADAAGFVDY